MAKGAVVSVVAAWCLVVVVAAQLHGAAAVTCVASDMKSCTPAVINGSKPTELCCLKVKEHQPCFCEYIRDPDLKPYIDNPNAKMIAAVCGVVFPNCPHI